MDDKAVELCKMLYKELGPLGLFPALTGGCVYKEGPRKDIDIVLYCHREKPLTTLPISHLAGLDGLTISGYYGFVTKAYYKGESVDIMFPEYVGLGDAYPKGEGNTTSEDKQQEKTRWD